MGYDYDLIVLGGGSGGSAAARRAAFYGKKVALVDAGFHREASDGTRRFSGVGGTCVNVGCVPKKLMFQAASLYENVSGPTELLTGNGLAAEGVTFDWATLKKNRDASVTQTSASYLKNWQKEGIEVVLGLGKLAGPHAVTVRLNDGGAHRDVSRSGASRTLTAEHILVCVGGAPKLPDIPGAEHCVTSDGFFDLETLPKKCAVVGAGYIAVEMAGILNALGCETTLFCRGDRPLRDAKVFDETIVANLIAQMGEHGPKIVPKTSPEAFAREVDGSIAIVAKGEKVAAGFECVLLAIGRGPLTQDIGLDVAGVARDARGYIVVDAYERTNVPSILALGDCTSTGYELTPVAIAAARRLGDRLYGGAPWARIEYAPSIPTVVFSHPPLGMVGLTEAAAKAKYGDAAVGTSKATMGGMLYSFNERKVKTTLKLVYVGPERRIVGLHILGPFADEMLQGFAVAVNMGATMRDFNATVCLHPTMSEELISFGGGRGWGLKDGKPERAPYLDTFLTAKIPFLAVAAVAGAAFALGRCRR